MDLSNLLTVEVFILVVAVIAGGFAVRNSVVKAAGEAQKKLSDTRAEHIVELEDKVETLKTEVHDLSKEVQFLRTTFTETFISDVVEGVKEALA